MAAAASRLGTLAVSLLLLGACRSQPRILRWHADSARGGKRTRACPQAYATLNAFVRDAPPPTAAGVHELPESIQGKVVDKLGSLASNTDEYLGALARIRPPRSAAGAAIDHTIVRKRIVFSVEKTDLQLGPANRIDRVLASVSLTGRPKTRIESWSLFSTEYDTVALGNLTLKQVRSTESKVGAKVPSEAIPLDLSFTGKSEDTLTENQTYERRYVKLTGTLLPGGRTARLYQEGARDVDLAGNFVLDVEIRLDSDTTPRVAYKFDTRIDDKLVVADPAKKTTHTTTITRDRKVEEMRIQRRLLRIPDAPKAPLEAVLGGQYVLRRVGSGSATIMEGDDTVVRWLGDFNLSKIPLVTVREIQALRTQWVLRLGDWPVSIRTTVGQQVRNQALTFATYEDAEDLRAWLVNTYRTKTGPLLVAPGKELLIPGDPADRVLQAEDVVALVVGGF